VDDPRATETVPEDYEPSSIRFFVPGTRIAERYDVVRVLGTGGSAIVYEVFDREVGERVALKVLRSDRLGAAALKRFRREVAVAREAQSPRLVRIFDIGQSSEAIFLAMELVEGESLRQRIAQKPLPIGEALRIAGQVLEGLKVLHGLGIVHRDIKPGNILLTRDGQVKLADFGLARRLEAEESRATATDAVIGTVEYLSPEQALGQDADVRSDLYAFGIVLFEMLTGEVPFRRGSTIGTLLAHVKGRAPDVRRIRRDAPGWLARFVDHLLQRAPEARYAGAEAALHDLEARRGRRSAGARVRRLAPWLIPAALAAVGLSVRGLRRPRFSHLVAAPEGRISAIADNGRVLWRQPLIQGPMSVAMARLATGRRPAIATVYTHPDGSREGRNILHFLDAETGGEISSVDLPSPGHEFVSFPDAYAADVQTVDLDRDGIDEVLVTFLSSTSYPSVTELYEPRAHRVRIVLDASGHHHFCTAADLDGDGKAELIFAGPSNREGWYPALAAVRVQPRVNSPTAPGDSPPAYSPDDVRAGSDRSPMLWYTLLPAGALASPRDAVAVDAARRRLTVGYLDGRTVDLGFDGFLSGSKSSLPPAERAKAREAAYASLRESERERIAGAHDAGAADASTARGLAESAGDSILAEEAGRVEAAALVGAGRGDRAQELFESTFRSSSNTTSVAFDAANAFHLAGDLPRAEGWYRRALIARMEPQSGRLLYEDLEGLVLALVEQRRYDAARSAIDEFARADRFQIPFGPIYRTYVRWRAGLPIDALPGGRTLTATSPNLYHYWRLEFENARGESPGRLLSELQTRRSALKDVAPLLRSLEGVLLEKLGRGAESLAAEKQAFEEVRLGKGRDTALRAHFDLVAQRYLRIAERAGRHDTAARVRQALASFVRSRKATR
jgi:tRNA A-37 threonylcarbamoyl transferase component Bud32